MFYSGGFTISGHSVYRGIYYIGVFIIYNLRRFLKGGGGPGGHGRAGLNGYGRDGEVVAERTGAGRHGEGAGVDG